MKIIMCNTHLPPPPPPPYIASLQAIALICCFVAFFFSCEEGAKLSAEKKIDQLVLTVGGADTPITFGADYNDAVITVPYGTDLTAIVVKTLVVSAEARSSVGAGDVLMLTGGITTITVTAEDGSKHVYTLMVMVAPRTAAAIIALTATIAGQTYSSTGNNPLVTITNNSISITLPLLFGSAMPASLSLTVLTLSAGASSTPAQGAALDLTAGVGMISVQAEDPTVAVSSYTVSLTTTAQPVVTTYTGTDTLGIAVRDVVEASRSVSFSAMDTVIMVSGLADASFDWALGALSGTKTATAGSLILTQSDLGTFPAMADATYPLTVSANGETSEGKDLFYYPGQVRTWRDLQGVRVDLTGTYRMMRDIAFPDADNDGVSEYNFEPVGRDTDANTGGFQGVPFSGTFDGGGRVLNNLYINRSTESFVGLFGRLSGTVRNVGLAGGTVTGNAVVGGLVGHNNGGTVQGAYVTGAVTGRDEVGSLVGNNSGTITGAYATGVVTGGSTVGGLVGHSSGTVQGVYVTGAVTGENRVGGLVGQNIGTVQGVYATGAVTGNGNRVGGLVGNNFGGTIVGYARGNVIRTAANTVTTFGRLVGDNSGTATGYHSSQSGESQLLNAAAGGNPTALTGATGFDGTARTSASVQADFANFDFTTVQIGQWIFTAGRWPALNLGDLQSAADQPTQ